MNYYKATVVNSSIVRLTEAKFERQKRKYNNCSYSVRYRGPFEMEDKHRIYTRSWKEAYAWLLKRRNGLWLKACAAEALQRKFMQAVLDIPCPNDTDGDGDCHFCSKVGECIWKDVKSD